MFIEDYATYYHLTVVGRKVDAFPRDLAFRHNLNYSKYFFNAIKVFQDVDDMMRFIDAKIRHNQEPNHIYDFSITISKRGSKIGGQIHLIEDPWNDFWQNTESLQVHEALKIVRCCALLAGEPHKLGPKMHALYERWKGKIIPFSVDRPYNINQEDVNEREDVPRGPRGLFHRIKEFVAERLGK